MAKVSGSGAEGPWFEFRYDLVKASRGMAEWSKLLPPVWGVVETGI